MRNKELTFIVSEAYCYQQTLGFNLSFLGATKAMETEEQFNLNPIIPDNAFSLVQLGKRSN